ncbi:MAG: Rid family hydrolase [Solirubrobacteraceae bacterium]
MSPPDSGPDAVRRSGGVERLAGDPPSPWEGVYGFSRVIRAGGLVLVGGTTSVDEHGMETRVYVTDISRADEVGRAHAEAFGGVRPLMTMVEVCALIDPRMFVEVEVVAVVRN